MLLLAVINAPKLILITKAKGNLLSEIVKIYMILFASTLEGIWIRL